MAYRTKVTVDVLSDDPIDGTNLNTIAYQIIHGSWSGKTDIGESKKLTRVELLNACAEHGTDPGFFIEWEYEIGEEG